MVVEWRAEVIVETNIAPHYVDSVGSVGKAGVNNE